MYDRLREVSSKSITLVISPLNALMQDQVASFSSRGVTAAHVYGDSSPNKVTNGKVQLMYMSPETILTVPTWREMFRSKCYQDNLICLAVDEAHLVQKWYVCACVLTCDTMSHNDDTKDIILFAGGKHSEQTSITLVTLGH